MRHFLGIDTPMVITDPEISSSQGQRVLDHVLLVGGTRYLSGTGALTYMPDAVEQFSAAGVEFQWSQHWHRSGDSVLTAYFDESYPMDAVLAGAL